MKLIVCAVYDDAVKSYMTPVFQQTDGQAIRGFMDAVNSEKQSQMTAHPEDFSLFKLAEYDDSTGAFTNLPVPECLGAAMKFRQAKA